MDGAVKKGGGGRFGARVTSKSEMAACATAAVGRGKIGGIAVDM